MRIYLDNCIFQDLKKEKFSNFLFLINSSKKKNSYCFSEAHLYDLTRDKSDEKYADMRFIEEIVESNCFFYNGNKINFQYLTPTQYYNSYDWSSFESLHSDENEYISILKNHLKTIPFDLGNLTSIEKIPSNCPPEFIELLTKANTYYDFFYGVLSFVEILTNEQKRFKEILKYFHENSLLPNIYEKMGIKGFDGKNIVDKKDFWESYAQNFFKNGKEKNRYDLFIDLYNGLELFGFVKGKPKKQKMMNLINDSRHAFFGGFCDIVVSKDEDFLNKTKFIYNAYNIDTLVLNENEFEEYLLNLKDLTFLDFISEFKEITANTEIQKKWEEDNETFTLKNLNNIYFFYFNAIVHAFKNEASRYILIKNINNFSTGTLIKEIEFITNKLIAELGEDIDKKGIFQKLEIKDDTKWSGRCWLISNILIEFSCDGKMFLQFFPLSN